MPKVSPGQAERQRDRLKKALVRGTGALRPGRLIVMDDESYFHLSRHSTSREIAPIHHQSFDSFYPSTVQLSSIDLVSNYAALFKQLRS